MGNLILKHNKLVLYVSTVVVSALMLFVFKVSFYTYLGIAFGYIFAFILFTSYNANKCISKIIRRFDKDCDPDSYIEQLEDYYKNAKKYGLNKDYLSLNLASGYMEKGEYQKAVKSLESIDFKQVTVKYVKCANLFDCYVETGDKKRAKETFDTLEDILKNVNNNVILLQLMQLHSYYRIKYYYMENDFAGAEKICDDVWSKYQDNIVKSKRFMVSFLFLRARICMELGQRDDALSLLKKVVELGNKLYIVNKAEGYIKALDK